LDGKFPSDARFKFLGGSNFKVLFPVDLDDLSMLYERKHWCTGFELLISLYNNRRSIKEVGEVKGGFAVV
jgi:hypothetical protein